MSKQAILFLPLALLILSLTTCSPAVENTPPVQAPHAAPTHTAAPAATDLEMQDPYEEQRLRLVSSSIEARGIFDQDILRVMKTVPRHLFVPEEYLSSAYADHPLPIGYGQTISQPYIVALMTALLDLEPGDKVLEIGTGSGYQAAVLAELGFVEVYSIEIIPELAVQAAVNLKSAGYSDLHLTQGDGYFGWEEYAPFDSIIVTAAPDHLPLPLVDQLAEGGSIVIPIGPPGGYQTLWRFVIEDGELVGYNMGGVSFVPFTREGNPPSPSP